MPTTVKTGWLKDKNGDKFAPKTLTSQVQTSDGVLLEDSMSAIASGAADDALLEANQYTDGKIALLMNNSSAAVDSIMELATAMKENDEVVGALEEAIGKKANSGDLTSHTTNTTVHITSDERTKWNAAKTHADSAHAPSDAEKNVQSDWNESNDTSDAFIKNKPTIPTTASEVGAVPTSRKVNNKALSADINLTASDVGAATTTDITNAINNLDSTVSAETGKYISAITQTNGKITATKASLPTDTNTTYELAASASSANGNVKLNLTAGGSGSGTDSVSIKGSGATTVTTDANGVITISSTDTNTDTNTHYTTGITTGASGTTSNSATSNPYIKIKDDNTHRSQIQIKGSGATSVSSDANGVITISSTNTTYGVVSTTANGLAPKRDGSTSKFLRADGTWAVPPDTKITVDSSLSSSSTNPVQNKVVQAALAGKADSSHTHNYLSSSGGNVSDKIIITGSNPHLGLSDTTGNIVYFQTHDDGSGLKAGFGYGWGNSLKLDLSGNVYVVGSLYEGGTTLSNKYAAKSHSHSYNDLTNKPTIPTVNNATLTIKKNGTNVATFTANSATNATANITVPTKTSELTNDSGFITTSCTVTIKSWTSADI